MATLKFTSAFHRKTQKAAEEKLKELRAGAIATGWKERSSYIKKLSQKELSSPTEMWEFFNCKNLTKISARVYNLSIILVGSPLGDISFANWQGGKIMRDEFTNHVGNTGYTEEEAKIKKAKVDDAYGVEHRTSCKCLCRYRVDGCRQGDALQAGCAGEGALQLLHVDKVAEIVEVLHVAVVEESLNALTRQVF